MIVNWAKPWLYRRPARFKSFPVQIDAHFLTVALCGAQCAADKAGHPSRGLAVVEHL